MTSNADPLQTAPLGQSEGDGVDSQIWSTTVTLSVELTRPILLNINYNHFMIRKELIFYN